LLISSFILLAKSSGIDQPSGIYEMLSMLNL
jgi:hypothetical protein